MMNKIKFSLTFILVNSFLASSAIANVECTLRLGNGCDGTVIYKSEVCKGPINLFNMQRCKRLCRESKPVCNVEDFDGWIKANARDGRSDGLSGELASNGERFDEVGTLLYSSEKTLTACVRWKTSIILWSDWQQTRPSVVCPRAKTASPETCTGGTVFDPVKMQCVMQDPSCGGGSTSDTAALIRQSVMLTQTQNNHFGLESEMSTKAPQYASTAGTQMPGLTAPTLSTSNGASASGSTNARNSGRNSSKSGSSTGSGSGMMGGSGGALATSGNGDGTNANSSENNAILASAMLGKQDEAGSGAAGGAHGGANGSSSGTSWFAGGSVTPSGDAASEMMSFDGAANGDAARGLAGDGTLSVEDPANYFMMSDIDVSLFKRVTAQCRKKEKSLVSRVTKP